MVESQNPLDSAEVFTMDKDLALAECEKYEAAVKRSRSAQDRLLMNAHAALASGKGIINIPNAIKKAGVDPKTGLPLLAIMRADEPVCWFHRSGTAGLYGAVQQLCTRRSTAQQTARRQYEMPDNTFKTWGQMYGSEQQYKYPGCYTAINRAPVPPIPPQHRPADAKGKYCILWHVEQWEMVAPVDPMLIKPLVGMPTIGVVVAHWDLTPVERMVMGALLGQ